MELRVLEYFLAVAREQNISKAAEYLHLTQPTLSRQLKDLEAEFGKQLMIRGKRKVTLTEDGVYFRKRAEEIVSLANRTREEMRTSGEAIAGDIYIGAGETHAIHHIARVVKELQEEYEGIRFHIVSGDTADLQERLDKGLFDFCLLLGGIDQSRYEYLKLPFVDRWGVLMHRDSALAKKESISPEDLWDKPLILSRQILDEPQLYNWFGKPFSDLHIVATYNLINNASIMAMEDMGYVVTLDKLVNVKGRALCFRPFSPERTVGMALVWKKYQTQSKAAGRFLEALSSAITSGKFVEK